MVARKCECPRCLMTHHLSLVGDGDHFDCECGLQMQVEGERVVYFPNGRGMMWLDRLLVAMTVILILAIIVTSGIAACT